jgi:hypothetical protein
MRQELEYVAATRRACIAVERFAAGTREATVARCRWLTPASRPNSHAHSNTRPVGSCSCRWTRARAGARPAARRAESRVRQRPTRQRQASTPQQQGYVGASATVPAPRASCTRLSSQRREEPPHRGRRVSVVEGLMILAPYRQQDSGAGAVV